MSCKVQQPVCSDCVTYVKSRIKFNTFNTFNNVIYKEEKIYLGPIRKFVKEEFEKEWNEFLDAEQQEKLYKEKSYEWQQIVSSKYDNDPNLME